MESKRFHYIFDLIYCNENIFDKKILCKFVKEVVSSIDMCILKGPIVAKGTELNPGLSVMAIIDFSHISIHTFVNNRQALIDIFSCKEYDREKVLRICKKFFLASNTIIREKEVWWGQNF